MSANDELMQAAVFAAFLDAYRADRQAGGVKSVADYQARFPGFDEAIAREYAGLQEPLEGAPPEAIETLHESREAEVVLDDAGRSVDALEASRGAGSRYREVGEVARGGMSVVLNVFDEHLRRPLAMKVLGSGVSGGEQPSPGSGTRSLSRFLDEAQITGQLAHPGIVPVHDMGVDRGGRVFFTMSLIRGRTFEEVIGLVHADDPNWTLARALSVLQRVCEAVAYAHAKGVIHRDLKPGNVMVGRFGETYVLDWGLARVVSGADRRDLRLDVDADMSGVRSTRYEAAETDADSSLVTVDGDIVGTPAYMSPEQGSGDLDAVGFRSDVYSIGAMLYHLLAGRRPFVPDGARVSSRTVLSRLLDGPPRPLHEVRPGVPAELVAICDKAMARDPARRYADIDALGDDLRAFLEVRVVGAYETGAVAELRKWVRRNKPLAAALSSAVLALAAGLVFSLFQKAEADGQASRADRSFRLAYDAVDRMLTRVGDKTLASVPYMQAKQREILRDALAMHRELAAVRGDELGARAEVAAAQLRVARIHLELGEYDAAEPPAVAAAETFAQLVAGDPDDIQLVISLSNSWATRGLLMLRRAENGAALGAFRETLPMIDRQLESHPDHVELRERKASLLNNVGNALNRMGQREESVEPRRAAVALRKALAKEDDGDHDRRTAAANALDNLGLTLARLDQLAEAEKSYLAALDYVKPVPDEYARDRTRRYYEARVWNNLSFVHYKTEGIGAARETLRKGIELQRLQVGDFPGIPEYHTDLGMSLNNSAFLARREGDHEDARKSLVEAVSRHEKAASIAPQNASYRRLACGSRHLLCKTLITLGLAKDAAACAEKLGPNPLGVPAPHAAGMILAQCAALAAADESLTGEQRTRARDDYCRRAVAMLRAATEHRFRDAKVLEATEFDVLREREDFAALLRELASK